MAEGPGDYRWSSYQVNALGSVSELCSPHQEYLSLGKGISSRQKNYGELFKQHVDGRLLEQVRDNTFKGMEVEMIDLRKSWKL